MGRKLATKAAHDAVDAVRSPVELKEAGAGKPASERLGAGSRRGLTQGTSDHERRDVDRRHAVGAIAGLFAAREPV